jgi:uncharacterized protein YbjT (DUF2867 family)
MDEVVLVTGATGRQGSEVCRHLLAYGFRVRALVRDPSKTEAKALARAGAAIVVGDFDDAGSLRQALADAYGAYVYGVYSAQAAHDAGVGEVTSEVRQGRLIAELAIEAGVQHFVYGSVAGIDRPTDVPHFDSKREVEKHIHELGLPATIVRPVFFMQNWERLRDRIVRGSLPQPLSPHTRHRQIAVQDIGAFAARVFASPDRWISCTVELAGDVLTMEETAETMSRVLGHEVRYEQVPWKLFEERSGRETTLMFRWFEKVGFSADPAVLRAEIPSVHSLAAYLRAAGWGHGAALKSPCLARRE